jgi:hypothetical protein
MRNRLFWTPREYRKIQQSEQNITIAQKVRKSGKPRTKRESALTANRTRGQSMATIEVTTTPLTPVVQFIVSSVYLDPQADF